MTDKIKSRAETNIVYLGYEFNICAKSAKYDIDKYN